MLLVGRQTNFISFSSQASITFGEIWEDKLSPNRTLTPNFFLKEGKTIEKNHSSKAIPSNHPLLVLKYLAPLEPPTHQVDQISSLINYKRW